MRRLLLLPFAALLGLGCSSSHGSSAPTPAAPAPAYVGTVATLVATPNAENADPVDLSTLNLQGLDAADDPTVFNAILGN